LFSVPASQKKAGPKLSAAAGRAETARMNISANAPKSALLLRLLFIGQVIPVVVQG
jgi:hypothetical protein